jgi:hypothetical protein
MPTDKDKAKDAVEEAAVEATKDAKAQGASDPAAVEAGAEAAHDKAREEGITISDQDARRIADMQAEVVSTKIVDEFDRRGAFDKPEPVADPTPAPEEPPSDSGLDETEADVTPPGEDTAPKKPSLAAKFLGLG